MEKPEERIAAKKSLGQHFLNNAHIPARMAEAAHIEKGDLVLEVGPGTGVLTRELLARGAVVIALEADVRALEVLERSFVEEIEKGQLQIHHVDVRNVSLTDLPISEHGYKVVANIPYYLSGKLFRLFLESNMQPKELVFLVQKEVAERIARDEKESLLSLSVKAYGTPLYVTTVKRGNFTPTPKVDSAIIAVKDISHEQLKTIDESYFFEILHLGFSAKRKQLLGNLSNAFDRELLTNIFSTHNIHIHTRGEDLPIETWLKLVKALSIHT
jgi:16S rRNA (adenine1518-N6/adenine1519-N6)-dimethyltransferase